MGDLVEVCHRNLDHHVHLLPFVVEVDGELSTFVEASLQRFRRLAELEVQLREGVEECEAVLAWPVGLGFVRRFEILDLPEGGLTLCVELVVATAQSLGERVVGVAVLRLAEQVALPAIKFVDLLLEPASLGCSFPLGSVVVGREFGAQEGDPVAPEDAFGVEVGDRGFKDVFADTDALGVSGELVVTAPVVRSGPALVPDRCAGIADGSEHPPPAGAVDHAPEHVGPFGRGVAVEFVVLAGASSGLPVGVELVVHPLRDQGFVDGFG
nr:hypothetical protein [Frankia sp. R43]